MTSELCEGYISKSKDFIGIRKELMFWDKSTKGKQTMNQTTTKKSQKHKFMGKETRGNQRWKWEKAERGNFNTIVKEAGTLSLDKNVS